MAGFPFLWSVIEQSQFVTAGKKHFTDDVIDFCSTIEEAQVRGPVDVVLCSSVLQYIENYRGVLEAVLQSRPAVLIIDRFPASEDGSTYITLQRVPKFIYEASYPCRIFSEKAFLGVVKGYGYKLFEKFESEIDVRYERFDYKGYIFIPTEAEEF